MATYIPAWWTVEWQRDAYGCDVAYVEIRIGERLFHVTARYDGMQGDWWVEDEAGNIVLDHQPGWYARREHVLRDALGAAERILGA